MFGSAQDHHIRVGAFFFIVHIEGFTVVQSWGGNGDAQDYGSFLIWIVFFSFSL
jgi:hypothetical protein